MMKTTSPLCVAAVATLVAAAQASSGTAGHATPSTSGVGRPQLLLSANQAKTGTRVKIVGRNCPRPDTGKDELTWHDSYQLAHRFARPPFRKVLSLHRVGDTVTATFTVERSDHKGKGLLDLFCGGHGGNAVAYLKVI